MTACWSGKKKKVVREGKKSTKDVDGAAETQCGWRPTKRAAELFKQRSIWVSHPSIISLRGLLPGFLTHGYFCSVLQPSHIPREASVRGIELFSLCMGSFQLILVLITLDNQHKLRLASP